VDRDRRIVRDSREEGRSEVGAARPSWASCRVGVVGVWMGRIFPGGKYFGRCLRVYGEQR
jgi:hypothetical protein